MGLEMTFEKVLMWMILLHLLEHSLPAGDTIFFGAGISQSGQEAFKTCAAKNARMPSVRIYGSIIEVEDQIPGYESECFWLGAKYDCIPNYTNDAYPITCCEVLQQEGTTLTTDCIDCQSKNSYFCEPDLHSTVPFVLAYVTWIEALKQCRRKNSSLLTDVNYDYRARFQSPKWINVLRRLNTSPQTYDSTDHFLCYCGGTIHHGCPVHAKTFCLPISLKEVSTIDATTSREVHIKNATSPMFPSQIVHTAGITSLTEHSITNKRAITLSTDLFGTSYANTSDSPRKAIEKALETSTKCSNKDDCNSDNWFLYRSIVGTISVLLTISTIAIIILAIKLRQARRQIADTQKKEHIYTQQLEDVASYQTLDRRNCDSRKVYDTLTTESTDIKY